MSPKGTTSDVPARCALGDPQFDRRYRAISARDERFDGQFITAVTSTGIYCRPSCPARTPMPAHVIFFLTAAAAQQAGFRACRRCRPDASPGTPEWNLRHDLVSRAMRLIEDGIVDREGVDALASRLGHSPRHVQRLLVAELGAGPRALARARRVQTARSLLTSTDLSIADVAFAAGFGSVRQFNDTFREIFAERPREVRARFRGHGPALPPSAERSTPSGAQLPSVPLDVELPVRSPFDAVGVFRFLAERAITGVEIAEVGTPDRLRYARTLMLPHGPGALDLVATPGGSDGLRTWSVRAHLELSSLADVTPAVARARRLLDLDADPRAIDSALASDPALAPLVAATPGVRLPGAVDPQELVVRAMVGQQISVTTARAHLSRLTAEIGEPVHSSIPGLTRLFPATASIAALTRPDTGDTLDPDRPLRLPGAQLRAVIDVARAFEAGELTIHQAMEPADVRERLLARPGIGPWTTAYVVLRLFNDPDVWLTGDVALLAGARAVGLIGSLTPDGGSRPPLRRLHATLADRADAWAPWRSYAVIHLWRAATATTHTSPPLSIPRRTS